MKKQEIISVLSELYKITGFRVSLHGSDYGEIAAFPKEKGEFCALVHSIPGEIDKCGACDRAACKRALGMKDTHIYTCRYGLTEAVSPLYNFGTLTGFLMMGQVLREGQSEHPLPPAEGELLNRLSAARDSIPTVKGDMIRSYVKIMTICAQYLTLSNAIPSSKPTVTEMAKKFIYDNYRTKFGIKEICQSVGCSKSTLITAFKRDLGMTVNDYITEVRLGEAVRMLLAGERTIGEIALCTGFSDQSYFSKVFSARFGMTPSEYRSKT